MAVTASAVISYCVAHRYIDAGVTGAISRAVGNYVDRFLSRNDRATVASIVESESAKCTGCNREFSSLRGIMQHWNRGNADNCNLVRAVQLSR